MGGISGRSINGPVCKCLAAGKGVAAEYNVPAGRLPVLTAEIAMHAEHSALHSPSCVADVSGAAAGVSPQ